MTKLYKEVYPSRWITLAAAFVFLVITGIGYAYALISQTLKDRLALRQSDVDTIAILGTIGAKIGIIAGLFNNRFGPQISIWIGVVLTCIGYALLTGITTQYLSLNSVAFACFANFLFNHGIAWFSVVVNPLLAQNFPQKDQGKLLGLGKGYLGIGSAFVAVFKSDLANDDVDTFMISTTIFIVLSSLIFGRFIVQLPPKLAEQYLPNEIKYGKDKRCGLSIALWYIVAFVFAIYLVVLAMVQAIYEFDTKTRYILFGVTMLLWLCPWILALFFHGDRIINYKQFCERIASLKVNEIPNNSEDRNFGSKQEDVGMPDIFRYWQLYVLYIITAVVAGTAVTFMDNTPQIVESASSDALHDIENSKISTSIVAIVSFGSFCGRVCGGFLVDYFAKKYHCSVWMIVPPFIMTITQSALYFWGENVIILGARGLFIGISIGWLFTLIVVSVSKLWGNTYLSGNFSLFDSATAVGSLLFSTWIFASVYDHFAGEQKDHIHYFKGTKCYGSECYKRTFLICACSSFIALILSVVHWRYTPKDKISKPISAGLVESAPIRIDL